mmetsp:Transcript_12718/g.35938  ORF Transcript_12718/g.35938 Transcript_12718/m.35938 type:complete len:623 (-) Transcript_12718:27-1895(-)
MEVSIGRVGPVLVLALMLGVVVRAYDVPDAWGGKEGFWYPNASHADTPNGTDPCLAICGFDISWDAPQYMCGSDNVTRQNTACYGLYPYVHCHNRLYGAKPAGSPGSWTVVGAGTCECPGDCSGHGQCVSGVGCVCDEGYGGIDCASVVCSATSCNGRGSCRTFRNVSDMCVCDPGYAGSDCVSLMGGIPPTPQLLNIPEYSSEDEYGDDHPIFNQSTIAVVHLRVAEKDLAYLLDPANSDSHVYFPADFHFFNGNIDQYLSKVGLRIKGNSSRDYVKKSWKVDIKEFIDREDLAGIDKITFKMASQTPSFVREIASLQVLRSLSSPAQRSGYAELYINGRYWGGYIMLEEQGQGEFLESRFGTKDGPLWKGTGGSTLEYESSNPEDYAYPNSSYKPQNDEAETEESLAALAHFIEVINFTPPEYFEEAIQRVLDVDFFLRTLAAEVMTGNWDGLFSANNYMLFIHPDDGKFRYYRYDVETSFGVLPIMNFETRDIWTWGEGGDGGLLINRVLSVASFRAIYARYIGLLVEQYVRPEESGPLMRRIRVQHEQMDGIAVRDYFRRLDTLYSYEDFAKNIDYNVTRTVYLPRQTLESAVVEVSIKKWIEGRAASAKLQLLNPPL